MTSVVPGGNRMTRCDTQESYGLEGEGLPNISDKAKDFKARNATLKSLDSMEEADDDKEKYTLWQTCGLNIMNMFGTGPFITIPYVIASSSPPGPQAMIGYGLAAIACMMDSFIWAELGSRWPLSGGSYVYLKELYGADRWGRLAAFMFVWQFFISGPAEIASGFLACADYISYSTGHQTYWTRTLIALAFCLLNIFLLYRRVSEVGKITLVLTGITVLAVAFTIVAGFTDFHPEYLEAPSNAFDNPKSFIWSMAIACRYGVYDFTGYYDVCQMGGEVRNPRRTIPVSCICTCIVVAFVYIAVYLAVVGFLPWDGPEGYVGQVLGTYASEEGGGAAAYIMATFCEQRIGAAFAHFFVIVVCITILGANFAMMCGFAYIPYAAAKDGYFFAIFAEMSRKHEGLAHYSLLSVGACSCFFCFFDLEVVIDAMTSMLVLVQFVGQAVGLMVFRYQGRDTHIPGTYKMPFFPIPCVVQIIVFSFIFLATDNYILSGGNPILELAVVFLGVGVVLYFLRSKIRKDWPFNEVASESEEKLDEVEVQMESSKSGDALEVSEQEIKIEVA